MYKCSYKNIKLIFSSLLNRTVILGLVGNGIVIWFLSFILKKNPITTYILNLAVADSCVLVSVTVSVTDKTETLVVVFYSTHVTSLYLLTAISSERCLSVVFPIWYRCHRLEHISPIVCALIWTVSSLLIGIQVFLFSTEYSDKISQVISIINLLICLPVVLICTVILFIKVCCSLHRHQQGKFFTALLLTLLSFLIFGVPLSATITLHYFNFIPFDDNEVTICIICALMNSSVNPFIYFLTGRKNTHQCREALKMLLERVFSDKVDCREDQSLPAITSSMMMTS
ncbi:proto-oncogene Mas-like [Rhineura floridana]|uniref:proto-oncogene Mas-like n=1 Tax=Rhineura floridana TaxID=261503 RepID=UPI002AC840B3|nr:proto-oncogene Mas-like [Rhineura floridana]